MPLRDTRSVDIIVKSPHHDGYDLILVDGGEVGDEVERYNLLIEKLTWYATYVLSGEFTDTYSDAQGKEVQFCVVCKTPPNEAMLKVEAIKPRDDPSRRFRVVVTTQEGYLSKKAKENRSEDQAT